MYKELYWLDQSCKTWDLQCNVRYPLRFTLSQLVGLWNSSQIVLLICCCFPLLLCLKSSGNVLVVQICSFSVVKFFFSRLWMVMNGYEHGCGVPSYVGSGLRLPYLESPISHVLNISHILTCTYNLCCTPCWWIQVNFLLAVTSYVLDPVKVVPTHKCKISVYSFMWVNVTSTQIVPDEGLPSPFIVWIYTCALSFDVYVITNQIL